jgi:hypothetical protein
MPDVERVKEELTRELEVLEFEIVTLARPWRACLRKRAFSVM